MAVTIKELKRKTVTVHCRVPHAEDVTPDLYDTELPKVTEEAYHAILDKYGADEVLDIRRIKWWHDHAAMECNLEFDVDLAE